MRYYSEKKYMDLLNATVNSHYLKSDISEFSPVSNITDYFTTFMPP